MKILCKAHSTFHTTQAPTHPYPTRASTTNIPTPLFRSAAGQRTETYRASLLWNSLPKDLRQIKAVGGFRTALRRHLLV